MSADKPLGLRVLNAFEHYFFENACLRLILQRHRVPRWESALEKLMADDRLSQPVHARFASIRAFLAEEGSEEEALQQLLKVFPASKDVN